MSWPVIKINCVIDEDYTKLLDKCIEDGKKLVIDGAIDRSVSVIEEEDFRKLVRERANKLYAEAHDYMERVKNHLDSIKNSSSVVEDGELSNKISNAIWEADELQDALKKFLDVNEWLEVPYEGKYIDEDGEEQEIYDKYIDSWRRPSPIDIDTDLRNLLEDLQKETERFYVD